MLAFAGKGYAMKNANPELLPYADEQISLTNDQDGVAKTLQDLFYSPYWPAYELVFVLFSQSHQPVNRLFYFCLQNLEKAFFCDILHI